MEITKKQFGFKLKNSRKVQQMTQEQVCENVDYLISLAAYSSYERGLKAPNIESLNLLTDGLEMPYDFFYKDYIRLLSNKKMLQEFAMQLFGSGHNHYAFRCLGKLFYLAKKTKDHNTMKTGIFRILMCRMKQQDNIKGTERMIAYITNKFTSLKKQEIFILEEMYKLSYEQNEFSAFIEITRRVIGLSHYEPEKLCNLSKLREKSY